MGGSAAALVLLLLREGDWSPAPPLPGPPRRGGAAPALLSFPGAPQFPRRRVKEATSPHKGGPGAGTALKGAHVGDGPVVATVRQNVAPAERKGAKKREVTWLVELGDPTFVATRQNAKGPGPDKPAGMRGLGDPTLTGTLGGHTGAKCPVRQEHCVCVIRLSWKNRK